MGIHSTRMERAELTLFWSLGGELLGKERGQVPNLRRGEGKVLGLLVDRRHAGGDVGCLGRECVLLY